MFFGAVGRAYLGGLAATHPPLERRIRAVDPEWDGRFPVLAAAAPGPVTRSARRALTGFAPHEPGDMAPATTPDGVARAVGRLDDAGLARAQTLIDGLPAALSDAAHDPFASRALAYGLVLEPSGPIRERQLGHVAAHADRGVAAELDRLLPHFGSLDENQKLVLIEMAMPALKELSDPQYRRFTGNLIALIKADQRIDLLEWVLHRLLLKELAPHFDGRRHLPVRHASLPPVAADASLLISALAREGAPGDAATARAFQAGMAELDLDGALDRADDPNFDRLNRALAELQALTPLAKPRLIRACAAAVLDDGHVSPRQAALLRGVAATLDCPLPPSIQPA
jgi:hypothetical protein